MAEIYDFRKNRTRARAGLLRRKQAAVVAEVDGQKPLLLRLWRSRGLSGAFVSFMLTGLVMAVVLTMVHSLIGIPVAATVSIAILLWYARKNGESVAREIVSLLVWTFIVIGASRMVSFHALQQGAGMLIAGIILASMLYFLASRGRR